MIRKRHVPYIFLLILILFLIFIAGVKYGGKVEETNKTIRYILSMTPTQKPIKPTIMTLSPTDVQLGFIAFNARLCGVKLLVPDNLKLKPSDSVILGTYDFINNSNRTVIRIWCLPEESQVPFFPAPNELLDTTPEATSSVIIAKQTVVTNRLKDYPDRVSFVIKQPQVKNVGVLIDKSLLPLLQSSLEITKAIKVGSQPDAIITP